MRHLFHIRLSHLLIVYYFLVERKDDVQAPQPRTLQALPWTLHPGPLLQLRPIDPKDKAVKRFVVRNMLDQASARDVAESSPVYSQNFPLPKLYMKQRYCIACAIHSRTVRARPENERKIRFTSKQPFKAAKN